MEFRLFVLVIVTNVRLLWSHFENILYFIKPVVIAGL
jgi:hypothetical protein